MKTLHWGYWVAWIGGTVACAMIVVACERQTPAVAAAPATQPSGIDATLLSGDHPLTASTNGDVYYVAVDGVYVMRGAEAVKVREVPKFTPPASTAQR